MSTTAAASTGQSVAPHCVRAVIPCIAAGVLTGSLCVLLAVSFAGLVFSGPLSEFLAVGIGMAFFGATVLALGISSASSYPGSIGGVSSEIAIIGVVVSNIAASAQFASAPRELLATVVVVVATASAMVGAVYLGLGRARLGNLIRYIPYPVMGGFVAGVGWLLLMGGAEVAIGHLADADGVAALLHADLLLHWVPALLMSLVLVALQRLGGHYLWVPIVLCSTAAGFYLLAWWSGLDLDRLLAGGWLMGPFAGDQRWSPLLLADSLSDVRWNSLLDALPGIATFVVTLVIGLLLVGASLEVVVKRDVQLNRELEVAGVSNLIAALGAGFPGYHYIGCSSLNHHMRAERRASGAVAGLVCGLTLALGLQFLEVVPRMVAATLLFFVGLDLLSTWLAVSFFRLTRTDYLVVLTVFAFVVLVGFMEGVMIGLILGIALFAFNYSRIDVVKKALTSSTLRSRVARSRSADRCLREHGEAVPIYRLEGFIFFGTVNRLLERIRARADREDTALQSVILDFRYVRGLDSSAAIYFSRLPGLAYRRGFDLAITSVAPRLWRVLEREGLRQERRLNLSNAGIPLERRQPADDASAQRVFVFQTLDRAMEWAEDRLLDACGFDEANVTAQALRDGQWALFADRDAVRRIMHYARSHVFEPGQTLTTQGAPFRQLHFILSGTVTVSVDTSHEERVRLRSMGAGTCVGEISMYLGTTATASVQAETRTETISLSKDNLQRLRAEAPDLHARLHESLAHTLAARLADNTRLIDILIH